MEWAEVVGRPKWFGLLGLVPIVGFFIVTGMAVAMAKSFGRNQFSDAVIAVFYAPILFFQYAFGDQYKYEGKAMQKESEYLDQIKEAQKSKNDRKLKKLLSNHPYPKALWREWVESIFFAVFAAAFIRMFLIEAYVIPTPSMEGSLNVGDYLFVSKASYGIRTPQTVAMVPLLHNRVPIINTESYFKKPKLPYFRLPAMNEIEREGKIVFNWPVGDSVYITSKRSYTLDMVQKAMPNFNRATQRYLFGDPELLPLVEKKDFVVRPMDKKDHYIKRCVGVPGDSLQVKDGEVWINGVKSPRPEKIQFHYLLDGVTVQNLNLKRLNEIGVDMNEINGRLLTLDDEQVEIVKGMDQRVRLEKARYPGEGLEMFPHTQATKNWSRDNFGPIYIPKAGSTVALNMSSLPFYKRIISVYENNDLKVEDGKIFVNGAEASSYTFQQEYYWGMGDNRHSSEDSRMWGYIPHDHIVGEPLFIWFSAKEGNPLKGINWDRIFTSARDK